MRKLKPWFFREVAYCIAYPEFPKGDQALENIRAQIDACRKYLPDHHGHGYCNKVLLLAHCLMKYGIARAEMWMHNRLYGKLMMRNNEESRLLGIECYRQAGELVKAALYSFFLLNGGAITAILAKSPLNEITVHIFWFIGGIMAAVLSLVTAFLAINEAARLNGGYDVSPFSPYAPRIIFTKFFFITLSFALVSLIAFLIGCIAVWKVSK